MQPERRGDGRNVAIQIHGKTLTKDLTILNLSTTGMAVELSAALKVGSNYPFTMSQGSNQVSLNGRVRWCRFAGTIPLSPGEHRPVYKAGILFTKIITLIPTGIWTKLKIANDLALGAPSTHA